MSGMELAFIICQFNTFVSALVGGRLMAFLGWAFASYLMYLRIYGG
jgi:hypothetical protein